MKSRVKKRVIALMLCMVMVLSSGISTLAEGDAGTPEATEEVSSTNDESAVNTEPDTAVAEESQSRSNTAVETETAAEENAPAEAEAQPKTAEAAPAENTEADAAAQTPVEETQTAETKDNAADAQSTEQSAEIGEAVQEETTTPETENETAQNTETASQPYEGKYEDDTIKITVNAEAGIVPEGAELSVTPIEKTEITDDMTAEEKAEAEKINDQYDLTEKKLNEDSEENEVTMEGFLAYDISFLVNGEEVEPNGDVNVVMEFQEAAIPEGVSEDAAVTVKHLKEDETAEDGVVVEDMAEKAEVQTTEKAEVEKVELTADSFSTFTITWQYEEDSYQSISITAYYVNATTGREISAQTSNVSLLNGHVYDLAEFVEPIDGYSYQSTRVGSTTGQEITSLKTESSTGGNGRTTYSVKYHMKGDPEESYTDWLSSTYGSRSGRLYFVYQPTEISIVDDIIENGVLRADYTGNEEPVEYRWYKSDSLDGEYTQVSRVLFENGESNISEDGTELFPAFDEGARKWYKVEAVFSDGETSGMSGPMQVTYYASLQNGSFEMPQLLSSSSNRQYTNEEYYPLGVWQSTGVNSSKGNVAIEIVHEGRTGGAGLYSWYGDWSNAAPHESQFAELNCEAAGALYQDVLTAKDIPLNYWLQHRARGSNQNSNREYDTMYLVIMPTKTAIREDLTTQENLSRYLLQLGVNINEEYSGVDNEIAYENKDSGILVVRITSSDQAWQWVSKMEGYTPTDSLTRFFFVAGDTASGSNTVGNFLDQVGFGQELPDVQENQFSLELRKNIEGLDDEHLTEVKNNIQFQITAKDKFGNDLTDTKLENLLGEGATVIRGTDMQEGLDGSLVYRWTNRNIEPGDSYTFEITETNAELDGDYYLDTQTASYVEQDGEVVDGSQTATSTVTVTGKQIGYVTFTNTYEATATKDVNFKKVWDDADNDYNTRPTSIVIRLTASITVDGEANPVALDPATDLKIQNPEVTLTPADHNNEEQWVYAWNDVPVYYTYNGVRYPVDYSVTEISDNGNYVYESTNNGIAQEGDGSNYTPQIEAPTDAGSGSTNTVAFSANSLNADNSDNSQLGAPAHKKYISSYDPENDEYTLNLDVKGAKGEASGGADILFVIDKSASMNSDHNDLMDTLKELLIGKTGMWGNTDNTGIIDKVFETEGNVNSVAFVAFSNKKNTQTAGWYDAENKKDAEDFVAALSPYEGTNWTWAMIEASEMMEEKADSNNEKVVVFLSDGLPTYSAEYNFSFSEGWHYEETGNGFEEFAKPSYRTEAAAIVNDSASLKDTAFYSVYLTEGTKSGMETFDNALTIKNSELKDGTNLKSALEDIMHLVIPEYKQVSITDQLSLYADFVSTDANSVTVTKTSAAGQTQTLEPSQYRVEFGSDNKTVTVSLLGGEALEDGATYTVSFKIKPSEYAKEQYAEDGYTVDNTVHQGDPETGDTSAGKDGFYSNNYDQTYVEYTITGETGSDTANYPRPVIQVKEPTVVTSSMTVKKVWAGDENPQQPDSVEVALMKSTNGGEAEQVETATLNDENHWSHTWSELKTKDGNDTYEYSVKELNVPDNYTCKIEYTDAQDGGTLATITNTYDENKEDDNLYIANVLKLEPLNVKKEWIGDNGYTGFRPDKLTVNIGNNVDSNIYTIELKPDTWAGSISVPVLKKGTYTASEANPGDAYEQTGSNYNPDDNTLTISNTLKTTSLTVNKVWNDGNLVATHDAITFELQYRPIGSTDDTPWETKGTYSLSDANNWTLTIDNLEAFNSYQVVENGVPEGYISTVSPSDDGFTITNTLKWTAFKVHTSGDDTKYLEGAKFELKDSENKTIATGESKEAGVIEWTLAEGSEIKDIYHLSDGTYTIVETKAPDGYMIDENGWTVEFRDGVLVKFDNQEVTTVDQNKGVVINLENEMLYELPEAGGSGIYWYMLGGVLLMMAGSLLVYKKRRGEVLRRK